MCDHQLLISTKTVLQYLINNGPNYQTVHSIYCDFYNFSGNYIPLFELGWHGYNQLVTFLQSIPDVLEVDPLTLQVKPSTLSTHLKGSLMLPTKKFKNRNKATFTPVLPWARSIQSIRGIQQPFSIQQSNAMDEFDMCLPYPGPRTYGDGKCSSLDSIATENGKDESKLHNYITMTESIREISKLSKGIDDPKYDPPMNPKSIESTSVCEDDSFIKPNRTVESELRDQSEYFGNSNVENISDEAKRPVEIKLNDQRDRAAVIREISLRSKRTDHHTVDSEMVRISFENQIEDDQSNHSTSLRTEYHVKTDELSAVSPCSSPSVSIVGIESVERVLELRCDVDDAPPPYSETDEYENDHYVYVPDDYYLSTPEVKSSISSSDSAIPFSMNDLEDEIDIISGCFFKDDYGFRFETTNIDDLMKVGSVYELYISEVNNPYKFWFQLGDDDLHPVDDMQRNLDMCYNMSQSIPPLIRPEHMKKDYACAALYNNAWYRGRIQGPANNGEVGIYYIDFGTVERVPVGSVRYIPKNFCSIPHLCHRGTLDFIKPMNYRWYIETTTVLIDLIADRKMMARVSEIDCKTNSVRLSIEDSQSKVNINSMLVKMGHAFPDDPRDRYQLHIADIQPSFEALEVGDHATFSEAYTFMEDWHFDYEKLMQSAIVDEFDCFTMANIRDKETMTQFHQKKEEAKRVAKQRDATMFLQLFEDILKNPFWNGTTTEVVDIPTSNPILH